MICEGCALAAGCKSPGMEPDESGLVNGHCDIMIIGEAPGAEEDAQGVPFVGDSGTLLRNVVEEVGLDEYGLVYTNVVHCRPPNNTTPSVKQINACKDKLLTELLHYNPSLIILLGNTPLKAVLGESGITAWRGAKLDRDGKTYLPTFHPAYALRNQTELPTLLKDFQTAYDLMHGESNSVLDGYDVSLVVSQTDAEEMYQTILQAGTVSWDTESRNAEAYAAGAKMIMLSFAVNSKRTGKHAWAVLPDSYGVMHYCKSILSDQRLKIITHNGKYDQHVVGREWGITVPGIVGDSMLASWLLDTTPGHHGLKELAGRLLSMYQYNTELDVYHAQHKESDPNQGGDQALVPVDVLAPYAAIDAIATLEIHKLLYKELDTVQRTLYNELIIPLSNTLQHMERNGVALDMYIVERYIKVYESIKQGQLGLIFEDATVQKFVGAKQRKLDMDFDNKYAGKNTRARRQTFVFNPNSDLQMRELLYDRKYFSLKPLGWTDARDADGKPTTPSTKWDYLKPYIDRAPVLKMYRYWSLLDHMLTTYLRPAADWRGEDGRVHSNYNIHGTVSGRLSSKKPNLQNIPTPEKEPDTVLAALPIKNIFTCSDWSSMYPDRWQAWQASITDEERAYWEDLLGPYFSKGGVFMSADYSGMELRTMASVAHCQGMLDIFARGEDLHRIVSSRIFNVPIEQVTKEMRYRGKWTSWTLMYGGDEHTLERLYDIPLKDGVLFIERYFQLFPEIKQFQADTIQAARDNGYVESIIGQRRYLPHIKDHNLSRRGDAEREAVNHPIQSVASQLMEMGLIILDDVISMNSLSALLVNTVHDSAAADVPLWEVRTTAHLIKRVLEGLLDVYKTWFPNIDLSWFICPLKVDIEVGSHYGSMQEYELEEEE